MAPGDDRTQKDGVDEWRKELRRIQRWPRNILTIVKTVGENRDFLYKKPSEKKDYEQLSGKKARVR